MIAEKESPMRLLFKQRFFSWFDSYDIYDGSGMTVYTVEGKISWGHKLVILDSDRREIGMVKEEILTFLPRFTIYLNGREIGQIKKDFTFFKPSFRLDCMGWQVKGDFLEWDYRIIGSSGSTIASISKEVLNWTDTYVLSIEDPQNALYVLMIALAIDAAKCSRNG